jgi:MerR family transcriptional regulator, Zn(II)-responsive regulator of zntA
VSKKEDTAMRIGELSERTGASVRALRYYEQKGLIFSSRLENGYRDFDASQVDRVKAIQFYLGLGIGIGRIEGILNCRGRDSLPPEDPERHAACEELLILYEAKLEELDEQLELLSGARARLVERISLFREARTRPASN